jgi:uncharacterized protein YecT (DUF1311 family)
MRALGATFLATVFILVSSLVLVGRSKNGSAGMCPNSVSDTVSNAKMRDCYTREQARVNVEADALAQRFAKQLRNDAKDSSNGPIVANLLEKAAAGIVLSQKAWKSYRDQYGQSVEDSWTTGSGGGTAYEACMYAMGRKRVDQLRPDFGHKKQ